MLNFAEFGGNRKFMDLIIFERILLCLIEHWTNVNINTFLVADTQSASLHQPHCTRYKIYSMLRWIGLTRNRRNLKH